MKLSFQIYIYIKCYAIKNYKLNIYHIFFVFCNEILSILSQKCKIDLVLNTSFKNYKQTFACFLKNLLKIQN